MLGRIEFGEDHGVELFVWITLYKKIKFSIDDFFTKCDQIRRKLRNWSYLLKKSLMGNFIFCAVRIQNCNREE